MMLKIDVLRNIFNAISTNTKILGMLALLATAFIGIHSIFAINHYAPAIYPKKYPRDHCESVFGCVLELYIKE